MKATKTMTELAISATATQGSYNAVMEQNSILTNLIQAQQAQMSKLKPPKEKDKATSNYISTTEILKKHIKFLFQALGSSVKYHLIEADKITSPHESASHRRMFKSTSTIVFPTIKDLCSRKGRTKAC